MNNPNSTILNYLGDFIPKVGCEVGVFTWDCSILRPILPNLEKLILVEPNKVLIQGLNACQHPEKILFYNLAIGPANGKTRLYTRNHRNYQGDASAFIEVIKNSPSIVNDFYRPSEKDSLEVDVVTFDLIDSGNIDLLSIDIEGSEWFVIKNLKSRPKFISVETHGGRYINPFSQEINQWMENNSYQKIGRNHADTFYSLK